MNQLLIILNLTVLLVWYLTHLDIEWSTPFLGISIIITLGILEIIEKIEKQN